MTNLLKSLFNSIFTPLIPASPSEEHNEALEQSFREDDDKRKEIKILTEKEIFSPCGTIQTKQINMAPV